MFVSYFAESILAKAIEKKLIKINTYALREYTTDKHRRVDGKPYGGGPGMVMWVEPIVNCIEKIKTKIQKNYEKDLIKNTKAVKPKILFVHFSPGGEKFNTDTAKNISKKYTDVIFICGRYEGIDRRVNEIYKGLDISIGDYVLTGGELPTMILIDSISRQIDGVLNTSESLEENRISSHNVYGRPEVYEYKKTTVKKDATKSVTTKKYSVPKVLLSGNHKLIEDWKSNTNIK
jgi:tRNA (guanine37-N1)-methyltransferase